ncbi:MAG: hypothetical protein ACOC1K_02250 [Nanoarchaeota archaeon]
MFFKKKKVPKKVTKHEFSGFIDNIKSHFLRIKDMQMHTLNRINNVSESHTRLSQHVGESNITVARWFDYFKNMHEEHKKEIYELKKTILFLNKKIDDNKSVDEEYIKKIVQNYVEIPKQENKELQNELLSQLRAMKQNAEGVINVNNDNIVNNDKKVTRYNVNNVKQELTKSEAKILGKLFEATTPQAYNDLARSTGHSPNTVKVYINSLKKKGVKFEEIDAPNGTKLYAIPNKDKVKKLYNF